MHIKIKRKNSFWKFLKIILALFCVFCITITTISGVNNDGLIALMSSNLTNGSGPISSLYDLVTGKSKNDTKTITKTVTTTGLNLSLIDRISENTAWKCYAKELLTLSRKCQRGGFGKLNHNLEVREAIAIGISDAFTPVYST